ncbi:hypothetical protein FRB94_013468 [Tulasnella sp. JGI-2019a]|nr:hypothetical protein FRB94_013468 [Tulasnella sp. JGI-2019a]
MGHKTAAQRRLQRSQLSSQSQQHDSPIVQPSKLLSLSPEILAKIIRFACSHDHRRLLHYNSAHQCDILLWTLVHPSITCMTISIIWRQVFVASTAQAVWLDSILGSEGNNGRIANSILFITVRRIGLGNLRPSMVSQELVNKIAQRCINLKRLVAPIINFKSTIRTTPFLANLKSLSITNFGSRTRNNNLPIAYTLASLSALTHLDIDADIQVDFVGVPNPNFSLSSLVWAASPSVTRLDWVLQNSSRSLRTLALWQCPKLADLSKLFDNYGGGLVSLSLRVAQNLSREDLVNLDLGERCSSLREVIISTWPLPSFLESLPMSIQHIAFRPLENMELWWSYDIDEWIRKHSSLRVLSLTGYHIRRLEDISEEEPSHLAKQLEVVKRWYSACAECGIDSRSHTSDHWPWADALDGNFESPVHIDTRFR